MNDCIHRWLYICNIHLPLWLGTVFVCVCMCVRNAFHFFSLFFSFSGKWNSRYSTVYAQRMLYVHVLIRLLRVRDLRVRRGGVEGEERGGRDRAGL